MFTGFGGLEWFEGSEGFERLEGFESFKGFEGFEGCEESEGLEGYTPRNSIFCCLGHFAARAQFRYVLHMVHA